MGVERHRLRLRRWLARCRRLSLAVMVGFLMRRPSRKERSEQRRQEWFEQPKQQRLDREHAVAMKSFREMAQANRRATRQRSEPLPRSPNNPAAMDQPTGWRRWWPAGWSQKAGDPRSCRRAADRLRR